MNQLARITRLEDALREILTLGHVCAEFEVCDHPSCRDSYAAWVVASEALNGDD